MSRLTESKTHLEKEKVALSEVWDLRVSCLYQKPLLPEAGVWASAKGIPTQLLKGTWGKKNQSLKEAEKADSSIKGPRGLRDRLSFWAF
jgi:hypothetical protein